MQSVDALAPEMEVATMPRALMIFARYPVLGYTKTRLAKRLGNDATLLLYEALLADTAWSGGKVPNCRHMAALVGLPADGCSPRDPLCRDPFGAFFLAGQSGDDFGPRLGAAMASAVNQGNGPAVLIGADSPEIDLPLLEAAFATLHANDVVLGPANDGGYYLIGMNRYHPELFADIHWSTDTVLAETEAVARHSNLTVGHVLPLSDLDYFADLQALARRRQDAWEKGLPSPCPATDAWLRGELPGQCGRVPDLS
jgi:rSAM/selenodomain-associated transferase 1